MSDTITCAQLVDRTQRMVLGSRSRPLNKIDGAIEDDDDEITVAYDPGPVAPNTYVGIEDEMVYVWEVDRGNKRLTVARGQMGTDAADHADGSVVEVNARFPRTAVKDTLQEEIRSWPDDVFQVKTKPLETTHYDGVVDLGIRDFNFIISVEGSPLSGRVGGRWSPMQHRVLLHMPRETFPSGAGLSISVGGNVRSLRVIYAAPFDVDDISDTDDVVEDWGLARSMVDIAALGAASRLVMASEVRRTDTGALGESRLAAEIPPTYQSQIAAALERTRDKRLRQEAMRLRGRYPVPS